MMMVVIVVVIVIAAAIVQNSIAGILDGPHSHISID
jgi:hypothetical protein